MRYNITLHPIRKTVKSLKIPSNLKGFIEGYLYDSEGNQILDSNNEPIKTKVKKW